MEFIIVSGLSGAGKSTVMSILEDIGFFCVDNLPPALIPKFAELCQAGTGAYERVAMVCDIRGGQTFDGLFEALDNLKEMRMEYQIVFVEADTETIIKRYKETRRAHPLMTGDVTLTQAVELERAAMEPVRERAAYVLETTALPTKKLRDEVLRLFAPNREKREEMSISVTSFGFKYGIPIESDIVFDVRFLPNPFYVPALKRLTGLDEQVYDYVHAQPETAEFLKRFFALIDYTIPKYIAEGKSSLVISIGCTGGQHRSVALTEDLCEHLKSLGYFAATEHRDIKRNS